MKLLLTIITSTLLLSGCSGLSFMATTGQGEYKNITKTERTEIRIRKDIGVFHVAAKNELLSSEAIDNPTHSLVDGNRSFIGVGVHTDKGTDLTLFLNEDYYNFELMHRSDPIRWGLYPILGVTHLDAFEKKRKTTAAVVGVGFVVTPNTICEATVTTRNNGQQFVDDYLQLGCGYKF